MGRFKKTAVEKLIAEGTAEVVSATRLPADHPLVKMPKIIPSPVADGPFGRFQAMPFVFTDNPPSVHISVTFTAPVHIESEMNLREHWASRKRRYDLQEAQVRKVLKQAEFLPAALAAWKQTNAGRFLVQFTRIGKRRLDGDNLQSGFKHVRDVIAGWVGIDDGSDVWDWRYDQQTGSDYRITVCISTEEVK